MSFIRHRRATSPNKFECRNYDSHTQHFDTSAVEAVIKLVIPVLEREIECLKNQGFGDIILTVEERDVKAAFRTKFVAESKYVNGVDVIGVCASQKSEEPEFDEMFYTENYDELLEKVDAVYIVSKPEQHYIDTKKALLAGKHVLCESPIALKEADCEELYSIAEEHGLVLMRWVGLMNTLTAQIEEILIRELICS